LSPMALPVLPTDVSGTGVGIRGGSVKDTASVAPGVGVCNSNVESGSPVDAIPVGVTVTETSLSSMFDPAQAVMKAIRDKIRTQRSCQYSPTDRNRKKVKHGAERNGLNYPSRFGQVRAR
jgi:hypothetical protein